MYAALVPTLLAALAVSVNAQNATTNQTQPMMRRVGYYGQPLNVTIETVPRPQVQNANDAVVRITKSALCGTDLHMVRGFFPPMPGGGIGHEAIGWVESVGAGVTAVEVGDYVVIPATIQNGYVELAPMSEDGVNPLQAEYALVPNANSNLIPVPLNASTTNATLERDYLLIGDVFPTSWQAVDWSGFQPGESIAIWGAGPVGLIAALSAQIRGASKIFVIDRVEQRLERASTIGDNVITIDFSTEDVVSTIMNHTNDAGVMRLVDAVGFEATDSELNFTPSAFWREMLNSVHLHGGIGLAGIWAHTPEMNDTESGMSLNPRASEISPNVTFAYGEMWSSQVSMKGFVVDAQRSAGMLSNLITTGVARPSELITTADISLDEVPEYYQRFSDWEEIKVYITFP